MRSVLLQGAAVAGAAIVACGLSGCEGPEADAIRAALRKLDAANQNCDGQAAVSVMSRKSLQEYGWLIELAQTADRDRLMDLHPYDLHLVLEIRVLAPRDVVEQWGGDGAAYQAWATEQCWYQGFAEDEEWYDDQGWGYENGIGRIKVRGDTASAPWLDAYGKPTEHEAYFAFEDGAWKINEFSSRSYVRQALEEWADFEGMDEIDLVVTWLEEDVGRSLGNEIWRPLGKSNSTPSAVTGDNPW